MKIYAVRDRMLDYYLHPFAAPDDKQVMGGIAQQVNNPEQMEAIAQAPQHFEIWKLGEVLDNGDLVTNREIICNCQQLVRKTKETANGP